MNRFVVSGLIAAGVLAASVVNAKSVTFDVANRSGASLTAIYTGPSGVDEWGENILGEIIGDGETVSITLNNLSGCEYDFRYEFTGKTTFEEFAIDVCSIDGSEFEIK